LSPVAVVFIVNVRSLAKLPRWCRPPAFGLVPYKMSETLDRYRICSQSQFFI
jgi:hypothetical protein